MRHVIRVKGPLPLVTEIAKSLDTKYSRIYISLRFRVVKGRILKEREEAELVLVIEGDINNVKDQILRICPICIFI